MQHGLPKGDPTNGKMLFLRRRLLESRFNRALDGATAQQVRKVEVSNIIEDQNPPRLQYDPGHPDANPQGYVAMPNVNVVEEMADMISATRAYEANVTAVQAAKSMAMKTLEIGK